MRKTLLSNQSRVQRHLSNSDACVLCNGMTELILHCLRDCFVARQVWLSLNDDLFNLVLCDWLSRNLESHVPHFNGRWCLIFVVTCVSLWINRNDFIFSNFSFSTANIVQRLHKEVDINGSLQLMAILLALSTLIF